MVAQTSQVNQKREVNESLHQSSSNILKKNFDETLDLCSNKSKKEDQAISNSDEPDVDDLAGIFVVDWEPPH